MATAKAKRTMTDRDRGEADGLAGRAAAGDGGNYLAGYAAGVDERAERHRRLDETCARWRRVMGFPVRGADGATAAGD